VEAFSHGASVMSRSIFFPSHPPKNHSLHLTTGTLHTRVVLLIYPMSIMSILRCGQALRRFSIDCPENPHLTRTARPSSPSIAGDYLIYLGCFWRVPPPVSVYIVVPQGERGALADHTAVRERENKTYSSNDMAPESVLEVTGLQVGFPHDHGVAHVVNGVSFGIKREETLGIVGESGCGKTVTALAVMGLLPKALGCQVDGKILYRRKSGVIDLATLPPRGRVMRSIRGNEIAMIFQEPMTSLNPVFTVGDQIAEAILIHLHPTRRKARSQAIEMLDAVGIPSPEQRADEYPHQMSGGMRQRAMIAMGLSCGPSLLIADEPTTALDVTIQAQVLELMNDLRVRFRTAIQFITHDLGVIASMANYVAVMYLGRIVEHAPVRTLFHNPKHPYTKGLLSSLPSLTAEKARLVPIPGTVPDASEVQQGCGFAPRCPNSMEICTTQSPSLEPIDERHSAACWLYTQRGDRR